MIVTLTPNPGLDLTYQLTRAEADGDVQRAETCVLEASGKGVNVSRALTRAGAASCAVLPCAGATGQYLTTLLAEEGVPFRAGPQQGQTRVNTTVLQPGGQVLKVNGPGCPLSEPEQEALLAAADAALADAAQATMPGRERWLALCGSFPPGLPTDLVAVLVELAGRHGARCAVDASGPVLAAALQAGADLVAPNRYELGQVLPAARQAGDDVRALAVQAAELSRRTGVALLVSLGADGALHTDGRKTLHAHAPALVPVNPAGAGDALLAGWLLEADDPEPRLARALRWGRSACLSPTTVDVSPGSRDDAWVTVEFP